MKIPCIIALLLVTYHMSKSVPCMSSPCQFKISAIGSNAERIKKFISEDLGEDNHCELSLTNVERLGRLMLSKEARIDEFLEVVVPRVSKNSKELNKIIEELSQKFNVKEKEFLERKEKFYSKKKCSLEPTIQNFVNKCKNYTKFGNHDDIKSLQTLLFSFTEENKKIKF